MECLFLKLILQNKERYWYKEGTEKRIKGVRRSLAKALWKKKKKKKEKKKWRFIFPIGFPLLITYTDTIPSTKGAANIKKELQPWKFKEMTAIIPSVLFSKKEDLIMIHWKMGERKIT